MTTPTAAPKSTAPSATTALICGLLALFCFPIVAGIAAIIFGNKTVKEVDESGGRLDGKGMGRFAQIAGWYSVLIYPVVAVIAIIAVTVSN